MRFIDTHCHLSDEAYKGEEEQVIQRALDAGVYRMLQADINMKDRKAMHELCRRHKGVLYPMLGLYPGDVTADKTELDAVFALAEEFERRRLADVRESGKGAEETAREELRPVEEKESLSNAKALSEEEVPRYIAIGEIGLDYHFSTEFKEQQKEALRAQLELAARLDLPVNIHLRDATEDFFDILESCKGLGLRGNLHAFSGSAQTAARLRHYGDWSVGLGGVVTFKNAHIARELPDIPLEMILLETDAPYLSPTPYRGTRNESSRIPVIAEFIAQVKGASLGQVAQQTTANALKLFSLGR